MRSPEPGGLCPASSQAERPPCRKLQIFGVPWTVVQARVPSYYQADVTGHTARPIAETKDLWGSGWEMERGLLASTRDGRGELQRLEWAWGHQWWGGGGRLLFIMERPQEDPVLLPLGFCLLNYFLRYNIHTVKYFKCPTQFQPMHPLCNHNSD